MHARVGSYPVPGTQGSGTKFGKGESLPPGTYVPWYLVQCTRVHVPGDLTTVRWTGRQWHCGMALAGTGSGTVAVAMSDVFAKKILACGILVHVPGY